jgi:hypothetical protein
MVAKRRTKGGTKRASKARAPSDKELIRVAAEQEREFWKLMAAIDASLDETEEINRRTAARLR